MNVLLLLLSLPHLGEAMAAERDALQKEKHALEARAATIEAERKEAKHKSMAKIATLANELEALRAEISTLQSAQREIESARVGAPPDYAAIHREAERTLGQALASPEVEGSLGQLFELAATALEDAGQVRLESSTFFGPGGRAASGQIVKVGALAGFVRSDHLEGPLVRIDGQWSLVAPAPVARAFGDDGPAVVPLTLTEAAEAQQEQTVRDRIEAGGALAWPIVSLAGLVLLILLVRLHVLRRETAGDAALELVVSRALAVADVPSAQKAIEGRRTQVARLTRVALEHHALGAVERGEIMESALVREVAAAERWLSLLKLIAAVAPLLGLLGTVMGMIETFDVISVYGSGDASRLSGGISKALVTTELGLLVAVPTLFVHGALSSWVDRIVDRLERVARDFPALLGEASSRG